ncbi:MAG: sodium:proton antiporter [Alphaproteobacteria bacterium]
MMLTLLGAANTAIAAGAGAPHLDGGALNLAWGIPFAGILLSIAVFPLVLPTIWHHHFGKISAFWALSFLIPFALTQGISLTLFELLHVFCLEYIPFIMLLLALFTVTGGIRVTGSLVGTPSLNLFILLIGTLIASWMGTTGAAMLLIHPLLKANEGRRYQAHTVIFFIFLVANIGGSLSPIGDPPLFLGFLKGVNFFWPTTHMLAPMLFTASVLLVLYYAIERVLYARESIAPVKIDAAQEKLGITGKVNFLLLALILALVLMSGFWKSGINFTLYHVEMSLQNILRDIGLLLVAFLSWVSTEKSERSLNGFSWFPIVEVAKLFAGIFLTIIPVIAILKAGETGALGAIIKLVSTSDGQPNNMMYFWATGILSSFLDNAPTYLVFFNTASGDPQMLMGPLANTLLAISAGAVFMGANTYIGNAPNFMVRSIAVDRGVAMPSFFGYMLWSGLILIPLYTIVGLIWF